MTTSTPLLKQTRIKLDDNTYLFARADRCWIHVVAPGVPPSELPVKELSMARGGQLTLDMKGIAYPGPLLAVRLKGAGEVVFKLPPGVEIRGLCVMQEDRDVHDGYHVVLHEVVIPAVGYEAGQKEVLARAPYILCPPYRKLPTAGQKKAAVKVWEKLHAYFSTKRSNWFTAVRPAYWLALPLEQRGTFYCAYRRFFRREGRALWIPGVEHRRIEGEIFELFVAYYHSAVAREKARKEAWLAKQGGK